MKKDPQKLSANSGFTFLEIVIVLGILSIIVILGSEMLFTLMKSSTKTRIIEIAKQEGDYSLSVMARMIRNALEIVECENDHVLIGNPDGGTTNFHFCGEPDNLIASESGTLVCRQARLISPHVRLESGSFSCYPPVSEFDPYVVGISFSLSPGTISERPEEKTSIDFKTTVSLRNF